MKYTEFGLKNFKGVKKVTIDVGRKRKPHSTGGIE